MKKNVKHFWYALSLVLLACTQPGVVISSPSDGSTVTSPVRVIANASAGSASVVSITVSVDDVQVNSAQGGSIDTEIPMVDGAHKIAVSATDTTGKPWSAQAQVKVSGTTDPLPTGFVPALSHVYVVVEENQGYGVLTDGSMPYLQSLASQYAQAVNYYASAHPSIGNYFMMTAGQLFTVDDNYNQTVDIDNIARQLNAHGKSWRSYAEGIPSIGYVGGNSGSYYRRHNPLSFFSDVVNNASQRQNLVGLPEWLSDLKNGTFPNFSFIVPDGDDDAHDGTPQQADDWLKANVGPLINSAAFQNDGLLIITFDEAGLTDNSHGGGHIPFVLVGNKVKKGFKAQGLYQDANLLKLACQALRLPNCPGAASTANDMSEFFK